MSVGPQGSCHDEVSNTSRFVHFVMIARHDEYTMWTAERVHNDNEKGYSPSSTSDNWITRCDCLEPGGHDTSKRKRREEKEDVNLRRKKE